jgi:hypothetical protein
MHCKGFTTKLLTKNVRKKKAHQSATTTLFSVFKPCVPYPLAVVEKGCKEEVPQVGYSNPVALFSFLLNASFVFTT